MTKYNHVLGFGKKCALLVSDMQRAYTEGVLDADFRQEEEIEKIIELVKVAGQRKVPVIYTIIAFDEYEILHPSIWLQKIPQLKQLKSGSTLTELDPRLPFDEKKDWLITKKNTSAFFGTTLASQLLAQGVDTLIITGCTTSGCVRATAVEGVEHGFRIMVVKDAVKDRWAESHLQTLIEINAKYGDCLDSSVVMQMMK